MLRVRWLGSVPYGEALALQEQLFAHGREQHLLLLEHPHVFTHGRRADLATNVKVDPASVGATLVEVRRGGDVTYHGPGQLVGYPIVTVANSLGAADHVCAVQRVIVRSLQQLGLPNVGCLTDYPGVWVDPDGPNPRKICAIGVRLGGGRTMHGFALNVSTDLTYMREYIVPCGIGDKPVTSLAEEGIEVTMQQVVQIVGDNAATEWGGGAIERQEVAWRHRPDDLSAFSRGEGAGQVVRTAADHGVEATPSARLGQRLHDAGVTTGLSIGTRKPEWLRPKVVHGAERAGVAADRA